MLAVGVEPVVPYPGTTKPWQSRCLTCQRVVTPSFGNVRAVSAKAAGTALPRPAAAGGNAAGRMRVLQSSCLRLA